MCENNSPNRRTKCNTLVTDIIMIMLTVDGSLILTILIFPFLRAHQIRAIPQKIEFSDLWGVRNKANLVNSVFCCFPRRTDRMPPNILVS